MLHPGQRFDGFEILRLLGKGGMGEVYEAQQDVPRRRVALKVVSPWLGRDERALERFLREVEVQAQLEHPGIVPVISCGRTPQGQAYYTMQVVQGLTLGQLIHAARRIDLPTAVSPPGEPQAQATPTAAYTPPTPEEATAPSQHPVVIEYCRDRYRTTARIGAAAARVLAFAHRRGYLHRDIKPSNLMIDQHGQVRLMDFGLTRALDPDTDVSEPGILRGTVRYMSPEQARGEPIDHRSDLYALGVTLFELASGGHGVYDVDPRQRDLLLAAARQGRCRSLTALAPDVPPELERIIAATLAADPAERPPGAEVLARNLERFLGSSGTTTPGIPTQRRAKKFVGARWAALAFLALAGLFLSWLVLSSGGPTGSPARPDFPADYPKERIQPAAGLPIPLLGLRRETGDRPPGDDPLRGTVTLDPAPATDLRYLPHWCRKLSGSGKYYALPDDLTLTGGSDAVPTCLALDDDPRPRDFELTVHLQGLKTTRPGRKGLGIFLGWHAEGPGSYRALFLQMDQYPTLPNPWPHGVVRIGQGWIRTGDKAGILPLAPLDDGQPRELPLLLEVPWPKLIVRVQGDRLFLQVGEAKTNLRSPFPLRGPLGIWVQGREGRFREIVLRPLAKTP